LNLNRKVAIVTGAGRGIGREISLDLAKEGCNLAIISRTKIQLERVRLEIKKLNSKAIAIPCDLSDIQNAKYIVNETLKNFGNIDILINNAGILYSSNLLKTTEEQWDSTMDINLKAFFFLCKEALRYMIKQKGGYIINISSTAALEVPAKCAVYGISKLGVVGLSQALWEIAKDYNIKVSSIYPGMTDTQMLRDTNSPVDPKKWMKPKDVSNCILFLLKQSNRVIIKDIIPWASKYDKI